jgi:hypothetical protein
MQALLSRDGTTEVELSTGRLDEPWYYTPGMITHVQSRATSPDGKHMFTHTNNQISAVGRATLAVPGLARGALLQVQANVKGVDPNRTDVVTVTDTVLRRPNLAVAAVSAPSRARAGSTINVSATIRETNGDVGNWGACSLFADGEHVDWVHWVWVDAGDAVTCAFAHRLQRSGPVKLEVRIFPDAGLRDDVPEDNVGVATVESVVTNEMFYSVSVSDFAFRDSTSIRSLWRSGLSGGEWISRSLQETRTQEVRLSASIPKLLSLDPLRLEVAEMTGGATIAASTHALVPSWVGQDGSFCSSAYDPVTVAYVYMCSHSNYFGSAFTNIAYERYAGRAVYHSYQYSRTWDGTTDGEYVYTNNGASRYGLDPVPLFGDEFAMRVRLHNGDEVFTADPAFPLFVNKTAFEVQDRCYVSDFPDYFSDFCITTSYSYRSATGGATG